MILFFILMGALAAGLPLAVEWAYAHAWIPALPSMVYLSTWLMAIITSVLVLYVYRAEGDHFVRFYLLTLVVKLLAGLGYCAWMIRADAPGARANIVYFLAIYLLFTALEIGFLYRRIRLRQGP